MIKYFWILALILVFTVTGCSDNEPGRQAAMICKDNETGQSMTLTEAREIAAMSECAENGVFKSNTFCNENTGTWWIQLELDAPGCSPACVVDVNEKTAEINYRCTGAILE